MEKNLPKTENLPKLPEGYEYVKELASGAYGVVWSVKNNNTGRMEAIKILYRVGEKTMKRFDREIKITAGLNHPNIVTIYYAKPEKLYFIMEFLSGGTLASYKNKKDFSLSKCIEVLQQIALGLHFAHSKSLIHRDLKPHNILFTTEMTPKITDFGIVKAEEEDGADITGGFALMGTPQYMAPEQWEEITEIDHRADIWAFGTIIYEMLTKKLPFPNKKGIQLANATLHQEIPHPQKILSELSSMESGLAKVCMQALQKDPTKRYQSAADMATELGKILSNTVDVGTVERTAPQSSQAMQTISRESAPENDGRTLEREQAFALHWAEGMKLWQEQRNPQKALPHLQKALELKPDNSKVREVILQIKQHLNTQKQITSQDTKKLENEAIPNTMDRKQPQIKKTGILKQQTRQARVTQQTPLVKKAVPKQTQAPPTPKKEEPAAPEDLLSHKNQKIILGVIAAVIALLVVVFVFKPAPKTWENVLDKENEWIDFSSEIWEDFSYEKQFESATEYQQWYAKKIKQPVEKDFDVAGASFKMILIPPGKFWMGSPSKEKNRKNYEMPHVVVISQAFWISKFEVTQKQWRTVMKNNPSLLIGKNRPVDHISWEKAQVFCQKIKMQLPTEAQWEYACRAGTNTAFNLGESLSKGQANFDGKSTSNVGNYDSPNSWGGHDFHGNVWEWCFDKYGPYDDTKVNKDPKGPKLGGHRVFRGGSWEELAKTSRSAYRRKGIASKSDLFLGLRLVKKIGKNNGPKENTGD